MAPIWMSATIDQNVSRLPIAVIVSLHYRESMRNRQSPREMVVNRCSRVGLGSRLPDEGNVLSIDALFRMCVQVEIYRNTEVYYHYPYIRPLLIYSYIILLFFILYKIFNRFGSILQISQTNEIGILYIFDLCYINLKILLTIVIYQEIWQLMQPKVQEKENDAPQAQVDLLDVDQDMQRINRLNIGNMERISRVSRSRLSRKQSYESSKSEDFDFGQQLNLDMLIQRLLQALVRNKIQLMELDDPSLIKDTDRTTAFKEYFGQQLKKYNKTLLLRETQLGALVYVIQNRKQKDFKQKYIETYGELDKFIINPSQTDKPINIVILQQAFETQIEFLKEYTDMITLLKLNLVHKKYLNDMETLIKNANRLKIINSKIATIAQVFPYACVLDKNDLFSFKKTSDRWHKLLETSISYKIYGDKETIKKSFLNLKSGLNIVNATMSIMHKSRQSWAGTAKDFTKDISNLAQSTTKILKVLFFKQDATHEAQVLFSDPNGDLAKQIWNLPQQKMFRNLISTVLPSIAFCQQFCIPRIFDKYLTEKGKCQLPQLAISSIDEYTKSLLQFKPYKQGIPMRINSPVLLSKRELKPEDSKPKNIFESLVKSIQGNKTTAAPTSVIFHIHGGGFISMSSFIHQTYTRIWANNLKVPIISVDYGKAPEHPFPCGLYDCFEGYMWTLYCYRQVYDAEPNKIILVGDSAGGNLVAALTTLIIFMGLRPPDGIVLVYPALNLNFRNYTPSLLTSLNDMILPHTFLKICLRAYLKSNQNGDQALSPYVSPINTTDEILKKYPPTRIFVGSKDPFHDDCCRFTQKLNKLSPHKAKLMIFDEFPHGFLQFDVKTQPHQYSRKATKQVQNALGQLLGNN